MSSTGGGSVSPARNFWINFWIYAGLVLGALASVSANIAYTYIPPHIQPAWWPQSRLWDPAAYIPPPGDVAVAVFCPVAIFILTEVITRPRWREGKLSFAVRLTSAVMVGLPVAVASYLHLCSLLEYYSTIPFIAYTLPLTVDGLMLACTAALQLTDPEPAHTQPGDDGPSDELSQAISVRLPHPRPPLKGAAAAPIGDYTNTGGPAPVEQSRELPAPSDEDGAPQPVGFTMSIGGRLPDAVSGAHAPVDTAESAAPTEHSPVDSSVGIEADACPPMCPSAQTGGSPVDASPFTPATVVPFSPPVAEHSLSPVKSDLADSRESVGLEPTGGLESAIDDVMYGRPVASGRLGHSLLDDAVIIELAMADRPTGPITATGLRKDFGVGSGRARRLREEIKWRRYAQSLADSTSSQASTQQDVLVSPLSREVFELISTIY